MNITFLGTNGWFDTPCGSTLCTLVETEQAYLILDAGSGFTKLDSHLTTPKPVYLFLSHFHLDHLIGLHTLPKFNLPQGLNIFGQPGTRAALNTLLAPPWTAPLDHCAYPISLHELPEEASLLPFAVQTLPLIHASPCVGYRFEIDDKVLAFCTDTGYCQEAVTLGRGADLLITECAHRPGETNHGWPHLDPALAARIAGEAGARQLVLTHFDAQRYPTLQDRQLALQAAREHFANTHIALDDLTLTC